MRLRVIGFADECACARCAAKSGAAERRREVQICVSGMLRRRAAAGSSWHEASMLFTDRTADMRQAKRVEDGGSRQRALIADSEFWRVARRVDEMSRAARRRCRNIRRVRAGSGSSGCYDALIARDPTAKQYVARNDTR